MPAESHQAKKLIEAFQINGEDEQEDELLKGDALIRANFGANPAKLTDEKWAQLYAEALWIETWRLKNLAEVLTILFGGKKGH